MFTRLSSPRKRALPGNMFGHRTCHRFGRLAVMSLAVVSLASACGPREAAPEARLVPTRTLVPGAETTMPTVTPVATSPFGLTPQNADQLSRVFQTEAPLPRHIHTATPDHLVIYSNRYFELVAADTLELLARTPIQVSDADANVAWYAASADGRLGAIMSPNGKVDIYDLAGSRVIRSFEVARPSFEAVSDIALTADGRELVIVSRGTLSRLRLSDGKQIDQGVSLPRSARAIRFAEDGSHMAAALANNELLIVQTQSRSPAVTLTLPFTSAPVVHFGFDPSGSFFAASSKEGLALWDLSDDSPRLIKSFDLGVAVESYIERSGRFIAINLSPMVLVYDLKEDKPYAQFRLTGNLPVWSVNFDPSGERMFVAGSGELASFDIVNRRALRSTNRLPLGRSAFSADGQALFTWSGTFLSDEVVIFDVPTWEVRARLQHPSPVVRVMPDEAGRYVAAMTLNRDIVIWHALGSGLISQIDGPPTDTLRLMLCFTPDGRGLAYLDGPRVAIYDLVAKRERGSFTLPSQPLAISRCDNPTGRLAIAGEQALRVLTLDGEVIATIKVPTDQMNIALDLSRDGGRLAALLGDQLTFWDVTTQQKLRTVTLLRDLLSGAFSPDGERFALNFGDRVEIVNVTSSERAALKLPAEGVVAVLFPPDPRVVVTVAALPSSTATGRLTFTTGELSIWDAQAGTLIRRITTEQPLISASISEDGALIAASTPDNALLVWGVP